MASLNSYFDFTRTQLRFLAGLTGAAMLLAGYLLVQSYSVQPVDGSILPVFTGNAEVGYVGIFQLDPNTAPVDSLELLPGIGPVLASRIVEYRSKSRFDRPVDITEVKGIGPKVYERLRPYLKVPAR